MITKRWHIVDEGAATIELVVVTARGTGRMAHSRTQIARSLLDQDEQKRRQLLAWFIREGRYAAMRFRREAST